MPPSRERRLQVAVAASPRLLGDSVRQLLVGEDVDVTLVLEPTPHRTFDVAVVARDGPTVRAELVIVLDADEGAAPDRERPAGPVPGTETDRHHRTDGVVTSLSGLVGLVRRLASERTTPPAPA